jgi:myo-inositol 2-dehydrogenase/D-chiro-inositol 1-dehydrogenase
MRRFDPYHVAVADAVTSGRLGRPILYKGTHRNATIPYDSRGEVILVNSAGHDIDTIRWLLGQEVEEVFVRGVRSAARFPEETRNLLLLQMTLTGHCLASVEVFVGAEYGYEVSAEVVSERGSVVTAQPDRVVLRSAGSRSSEIPFDWLERFQEAYVIELREWVRSIRTGTRFAGANAQDGATAVAVTAACVQSLRSGLPVILPTITHPASPATNH